MTSSGLVVVDKPPGLTSHDVVARLRRLVGTRKVGHAGTLDPMATGVLVLGVGKVTRLLGFIAGTDKAYDATLRLGATTTTDDADGDVVSRADASGLDEDAVRDVLGGLVGEIDQVPSTVSAVKIGGRRAHALARAGEEVALPPRRVSVHRLDVVALRRGAEYVDVEVSVVCSSGTYIRALARDAGTALGVGGHLTALRRTRVGRFEVGEAVPLAELEEAGAGELMSPGEVARRCFVTVEVDASTAQAIGFGRRLQTSLPAGPGPVAMLGPAGDLLALYEQRGADAVPLAVLV